MRLFLMRSYDDVLRNNIEAYDAAVAERAGRTIDGWKLDEHEQFTRRLVDAGCTSIVEIGAGTGAHSRRFADQGFDVVATDPSPAMVRHCQSIGLDAMQTDVLGLQLDAPRDAAFSMNALLHVPSADLPAALERLRANVRSGGLVYIGMYGGFDEEGTRDGDHYVPKRWFVSHSDDRLTQIVSEAFEIIDFHAVDLGDPHGFHFQSLTLTTRHP